MAEGRVVGGIFVAVRPDASRFRSELRRELRTAAAAEKVEVKLGVNARGLKTELRRAVKEAAAGLSVNVDVHANTRGLKTELRRGVKEASAGVDATVGINLNDRGLRGQVSRAAKAAGAGQNVNVGLNLGGLGGAASGIAGLGASLLKLPLLAAGAIALAPALMGVAGAALAVAGSLSSVVAVGAVVPGIFAAMASGAGVGIIALLGIGKAVGELGKAHKAAGASAASSAGAQRAAADAIISAQQGVARAERTLVDSKYNARQAEEALTQARRDARQALIDLRQENDRNTLSEERASISLAEAQQRAIEVLADPKATQLQRDSATLAVREAQQGLDEITTAHKRSSGELESANKKGIRGAEHVVTAQRNVVEAHRATGDAQQEVANAQRSLVRAQQSAIELNTKQAASATSLTEAYDKLSPAGKKFARFLDGLKGKWAQLQAVAQGGFLPGLQSGIKVMVDRLFPGFLRFVGKMGTELGGLAKQAGNLFSSKEWKTDFETIGNRNIKVVDTLGKSGLNFATVIKDLTIAAGPLLQRLADGVLALSEWAEKSTAAGRSSGRLGRFFERVGDRLSIIWNILKNLGVAIYNIFSNGTGLGDHLLENIEGITQKFADWTGSDEGQTKIKNFFKSVKTIAHNLGEDIKKIAGGIKKLADSPAVKKIIDFAEKHPGLIAAGIGGGAVAGKAGVPGAAGSAAKGIGKALLPGAGVAAGEAAPSLVAFLPEIAAGAAIITALVGSLILAWKHSQFFRDAWAKVGEAFKKHEEDFKTVGSLLFNIGKVVGWLAGLLFGTLLESFAATIDVIGTVIHWIKSLDGWWDKAVDAVYNFAVKAGDWFGQFGGKIYDTYTDIKGWLLSLPKNVWNKVTSGVKTWVDTMGEKFNALKEKARAPFEWIKKNVFGTFFDLINKIPGVNIANPFKEEDNPYNKGGNAGGQKKAAGGAIYGPGGPQSDSIPAWLSNGEHVWTALEVQKAGGHGAMERMRRAVKGFRRGGGVETYGGSTAWTQQAGHTITSVFGALPGGIGGRATSGHQPNSDHYTGNALDLMTLGNRGLGNRISDYILSNWGKLHAKYVIWLQRINSGKGWKGMADRGSPTANHMDHVHLSVLGGGAKSLIGQALGAISDPVGTAVDFAKGKLKGKFKDNAFGQALVGGAGAGVDKIAALARSMVSKVGGGALDIITNPLGAILGGGKGGNVELGKKMAAARGWKGAQWDALNALWQKESGWRTNADNPTSSAYGIPQALPGSKMAAAGADWRTNAATQIAWGLSYIAGRYGSPAGAWAHSQKTNWYSKGGPVRAYGDGGWINEPVMGKGLWSGAGYKFGENGPEHVSPNGGHGPAIHIENAFFEDGADIDALNHRAAFARMAGS